MAEKVIFTFEWQSPSRKMDEFKYIKFNMAGWTGRLQRLTGTTI
ncbi:hypothetical protein [Evansella clarkii]|nr:hypothetical protein [Evansella clarkii]